jgi:hypothetical protein
MNDQLLPEIRRYRKPDHLVHPLILNRWSPRAMNGETISDEELMSLFEAARWAPSSYIPNVTQKSVLGDRESSRNLAIVS